MLRTIQNKWRNLSLARQFFAAGSLVLIVGMLLIGSWVTEKIESGVTRNTAASTALYLDSVVSPLIQELATTNSLAPAARAKLDQLLQETTLGRRIVSFKIWKEGGLVVYSSRPDVTGQIFPTTENLRRAWAGEVSAEFDTLEDEEDAIERTRGEPLLEMYSPVRESLTGRIIAVGEFYEAAGDLKENLFWTNVQSWLVVTAVTLSMLAVLSGIVAQGSRTIASQRLTLEQRIVELSELLRQNEELRNRVERASRRAAELNELFLRRIGADLHDGPAQLLALALLRLDALAPGREGVQRPSDGARSDVEAVREALAEALSEMRSISSGLSLPELDNLPPGGILKSAVYAHERRTGTKVVLILDAVPETLEKSTKICVYRFVQEGLNNAFRHAGGLGQKVVCRGAPETLEVEVADAGRGFSPREEVESAKGLGLVGLRGRIESLGGKLDIVSAPGDGSRLIMRLPLQTATGKNV